MGYDGWFKVGGQHEKKIDFFADCPSRTRGVAFRRSHSSGTHFLPTNTCKRALLKRPDKTLAETPHVLAGTILRDNTREKGLGEKLTEKDPAQAQKVKFRHSWFDFFAISCDMLLLDHAVRPRQPCMYLIELHPVTPHVTQST